MHAELRKEKAQRSAGGVTPGANNSSYNIAAIRGAQEQARLTSITPSTSAVPSAAPAPSRSAASSASVSTGAAPGNAAARQPFIPRALNSGRAGGGSGSGGGVALRDPHLRSSPHSDAENERLVGDTEALSEAYLEQEDELIQSHRKEIEVSMNAVRQEMTLLGRVRFTELLLLFFGETPAQALFC
jgi:hypothetical protein